MKMKVLKQFIENNAGIYETSPRFHKSRTLTILSESIFSSFRAGKCR
jgi:hypothetical protein